MNLGNKARSVLIVEDNPDDAELAILAMKKAGIQAHYFFASNGDEALKFLAESREQQQPSIIPELVLLDLNLPGKHGLQILRELRSSPRTRWIPVVILTTSKLEEDIKNCYEAGANGYIVKPFDFSIFCYYMKVIFQYWFEVNRQPVVFHEYQRITE